MKAGDTISIDTGSATETRKIASLGTAASNHTTLWQPLPDGPVITIPAGSTNVPVTSVERLRGRPEDCSRLWRHLPRRRKRPGAVRGGHGHRGRQAGHASLPGGGRARRSGQHQGDVGLRHLGRRQDQAGHRQCWPWDRDRDGHACRHAGQPDQSLGRCECRRDPYQGSQCGRLCRRRQDHGRHPGEQGDGDRYRG